MCVDVKKIYQVYKKKLFFTVISVLDEPYKVAADLSIVRVQNTIGLQEYEGFDDKTRLES